MRTILFIGLLFILILILSPNKETFNMVASDKIKGYYLWTWKAPHVDGKPQQVVLLKATTWQSHLAVGEPALFQ